MFSTSQPRSETLQRLSSHSSHSSRVSHSQITPEIALANVRAAIARATQPTTTRTPPDLPPPLVSMPTSSMDTLRWGAQPPPPPAPAHIPFDTTSASLAMRTATIRGHEVSMELSAVDARIAELKVLAADAVHDLAICEGHAAAALEDYARLREKAEVLAGRVVAEETAAAEAESLLVLSNEAVSAAIVAAGNAQADAMVAGVCFPENGSGGLLSAAHTFRQEAARSAQRTTAACAASEQAIRQAVHDKILIKNDTNPSLPQYLPFEVDKKEENEEKIKIEVAPVVLPKRGQSAASFVTSTEVANADALESVSPDRSRRPLLEVGLKDKGEGEGEAKQEVEGKGKSLAFNVKVPGVSSELSVKARY